MKHRWKWIGAAVLVVGALAFWMINNEAAEQKEWMEVYHDWVSGEMDEYRQLSYHLEGALASSSPEATLGHLYRAVESDGSPRMDTNIPLKMDVASPLGEMPYVEYPFYSGDTYGYIDYVIEEWDNQGLSTEEWRYLKTVLERSRAAEAAFESIQQSLYEDGSRVNVAFVREELRTLQEKWDSYQSARENDPAFEQYLYGDKRSNIVFHDEKKLTRNEVGGIVQNKAMSILPEASEVSSSGGGIGGLYPEFGAYYHFESDDEVYLIDAAENGGHILGLSNFDREKLTYQSLSEGQLKEDAARRVNAWKEEEWKIEAITRSNQDVDVFFYPVKEGVAVQAQKVVVSYDEEEGQYALSEIMFKDYYTQPEQLEAEPTITAEAAWKEVNPHLEKDGEAELEFIEVKHESVLAYRLPVTGLDGVSAVWINADSGEYIKRN
ncbi:hypothetical protein LCM20_06560 [Halobacillus litoralis]|uniref:hypothetical protein n=1 Tax=Halobacillus litoralis TaxID=45668 RepID=UPI001CD3427B|nr:hypothetical protein [Halobacillus litoralis]MCA0970243.1 hypothetical protein [Halobacillus litoralis]